MNAERQVCEFGRNAGLHSCGVIPEAKKTAKCYPVRIYRNLLVDVQYFWSISRGKTIRRKGSSQNHGGQPTVHSRHPVFSLILTPSSLFKAALLLCKLD